MGLAEAQFSAVMTKIIKLKVFTPKIRIRLSVETSAHL